MSSRREFLSTLAAGLTASAMKPTWAVGADAPEIKSRLNGPIGLQLHSNTEPQEVHFKDLILTTFPEPVMITLR